MNPQQAKKLGRHLKKARVALGITGTELSSCFRQPEHETHLTIDDFRLCIDGKSTGAVRVSLGMVSNVEDVDRSFKRAVDAGARVGMPLTDMFWGDRYGKVTDPFGHEWGLATRKENVAPEEMGFPRIAF